MNTLDSQAQRSISPAYVGDGIYIQSDPEDPTRLILTTNSHKLIDADAVIYLEASQALYLSRVFSTFFQNLPLEEQE